MSFHNIYYKRTTATAKACYICFKPTTTVLATIDAVDFLYTCPAHLADRGFATLLGDVSESIASKKMGLSTEEIQKVKEEWEEEQKRKREKKKEKEKDKEKGKEKAEDKPGGRSDTKTDAKSASVSVPAPTPSRPEHQRYALHRDFFAMRQALHRKRRQAAQAKELAPRLPGAPRGTFMPGP